MQAKGRKRGKRTPGRIITQIVATAAHCIVREVVRGFKRRHRKEGKEFTKGRRKEKRNKDVKQKTSGREEKTRGKARKEGEKFHCSESASEQ